MGVDHRRTCNSETGKCLLFRVTPWKFAVIFGFIILVALLLPIRSLGDASTQFSASAVQQLVGNSDDVNNSLLPTSHQQISSLSLKALIAVFSVSVLIIVVFTIILKRFQSAMKESFESQDKLNHQNREMSKLNHELKQLSYSDELTGLYNRRGFLMKVEDALRHLITEPTKQVGVVFIDLDDFKVVNDSLGHDTGDKLLLHIAQAIRELDTNMIVGRFGGDEFVILAEGDDLAQHLSEFAAQLIDELFQPVSIDGRTVFTTVSVGVALSRGVHESASDLLRKADLAMYHAKGEGKNRIAFFESSMKATLERRFEIENALRTALRDDEFEIYLQPIVDLTTNKVIGAESLIRWDSKELGWVSPGEFITVAEENGSIVEIGAWILQQSCDLLEKWSQDPAFADLRVSVNVSSRQIAQDNFVDLVKTTVTESKNLTLEVTESCVMLDEESLVDRLEQLRSHGMKIALDDFGTGYSSLSMLVRLPIDILKIDRTFVMRFGEDDRSSALTKSMVALSRSLGLDVIGEGIETDYHAESLLNLGCKKGQGYLYAKPMTVKDFEVFIEDQLDQVA